MKFKFEANLADVCLPDYWGGHHLAHVAVPVDSSTTIDDFKDLLTSEVNEGAFAGSVDWETTEKPEFYEACKEAIEAISTKTPGYQGPLFPNLDTYENDEYSESCFAYVVFVPVENA